MHSLESLGGAYLPALTGPGPAPGPLGGSRHDTDAGSAVPSRVSKGCSAALQGPPGELRVCLRDGVM